MPQLQLTEEERAGIPPEKLKSINDVLANMEDGIRFMIRYENSVDCI